MKSLGLCAIALAFAPEAFCQEAELPRIVVEEGEAKLLWGEHLVMRELEMRVGRQAVPFEADRVAFRADDKGVRFVPATEEDRELVLRGTYCLSYEPRALSLDDSESDVLQITIGRATSELCDTLVDPETEYALTAPGCLRLRDWDEGGLAELRFRLADEPRVEFRKMDALEDRSAAAVLRYLDANFLRKDGEASPRKVTDFEQIFQSALPGGLQRRSLHPLRRFRADQPLLVNVRVGAIPSRPGFDVLLLLNPTDRAVSKTIDLGALGWQQPGRKRFLAYSDGTFLPDPVGKKFTLDVPARGWTVASLRELMPVASICNSTGALGQVLHPWVWESISSAPSGEPTFTIRWRWNRIVPGEAWTIVVLPRLENRLMLVESVALEGLSQAQEPVFEQIGAILKVKIGAVAAGDKPILAIKFGGWLDE